MFEEIIIKNHNDERIIKNIRKEGKSDIVKKKVKESKGITLIALVITIIVLLILVGISITTLVGTNGIITKSKESKVSTEIANDKEKIKSAYSTAIINKRGDKVEVEDLNKALADDNVKANATTSINPGEIKVKFTESQREYTITTDGKIQEENTEDESLTETLPSTADTKPFLPKDARVINKDLDKGLTIIDKNDNEWVWIEVPKNIYKNAKYNIENEQIKSTDYDKIEAVLHKYTEIYRGKTKYEDIWYAQDANETIITEKTPNLTDEQKALNNGCGLTYDEYISKKQKMLTSVYENGGFYIGKYEAGAKDIETNGSHKSLAVIKEGAYPYNCVTCSQAQSLSAGLSTDNDRVSSLMFGVQWDLVLKHIEVKRKKLEKENNLESIQKDLNENSTSWGNYLNSEFVVKEGKYSEDGGETFKPNIEYNKESKVFALFTTGATVRNSVLNIYDLAGNLYELTLEKSSDNKRPCAKRGGSCGNDGNSVPSSHRGGNPMSNSYYGVGFRPALY